MLGIRWDGQTWATIKAELRSALELQFGDSTAARV
jgi:hypothetical protein